MEASLSRLRQQKAREKQDLEAQRQTEILSVLKRQEAERAAREQIEKLKENRFQAEVDRALKAMRRANGRYNDVVTTDPEGSTAVEQAAAATAAATAGASVGADENNAPRTRAKKTQPRIRVAATSLAEGARPLSPRQQVRSPLGKSPAQIQLAAAATPTGAAVPVPAQASPFSRAAFSPIGPRATTVAADAIAAILGPQDDPWVVDQTTLVSLPNSRTGSPLTLPLHQQNQQQQQQQQLDGAAAAARRRSSVGVAGAAVSTPVAAFGSPAKPLFQRLEEELARRREAEGEKYAEKLAQISEARATRPWRASLDGRAPSPTPVRAPSPKPVRAASPAPAVPVRAASPAPAVPVRAASPARALSPPPHPPVVSTGANTTPSLTRPPRAVSPVTSRPASPTRNPHHTHAFRMEMEAARDRRRKAEEEARLQAALEERKEMMSTRPWREPVTVRTIPGRGRDMAEAKMSEAKVKTKVVTGTTPTKGHTSVTVVATAAVEPPTTRRRRVAAAATALAESESAKAIAKRKEFRMAMLEDRPWLTEPRNTTTRRRRPSNASFLDLSLSDDDNGDGDYGDDGDSDSFHQHRHRSHGNHRHDRSAGDASSLSASFENHSVASGRSSTSLRQAGPSSKKRAAAGSSSKTKTKTKILRTNTRAASPPPAPLTLQERRERRERLGRPWLAPPAASASASRANSTLTTPSSSRPGSPVRARSPVRPEPALPQTYQVLIAAPTRGLKEAMASPHPTQGSPQRQQHQGSQPQDKMPAASDTELLDRLRRLRQAMKN